MMIFSLVAMIGLEKCCITSACLQWLCHSGERIVARGPLVNFNKIHFPLFFIAYIYGRLTLSRIPRDSQKHFGIAVPRSIRVAEVRKTINRTTTFNK